MLRPCRYFALSLLGCATAMAQDRAVLENADANKDGNITRAEFIEARSQLFARLDVNKDGHIDDADAPAQADGQSRNNRRTGRMRAQLDANGDGKISKSEFVDAPAPVFDRADTNHDGTLQTQEIEAIRGKARDRAGRTRPEQGKQN